MSADRDRISRLGLPLVLVAAAALRWWNLGARSLWTDEGSAWTAASSPLPRMIHLCAVKDASPPLYYLLSSLALRFGDSEVQVRLVSFLASIGLVWITYRLARLAWSRGTAAVAAAFMALSPFQLMYAQEGRTYALVAFLTLAALHLFARAVLFDRRRAWLPFVLVSALALYSQDLALLGVGVQAAFVVLTPAGRRRFVPWMLAQVAVLALYLPWLFVSLAQAEHLSSSHWYLESPDSHGVFQVLRAVFLSPVPVVTPIAGATWPGLEAWLPRPAAHALLLLLPAVPLAAAAAGSLDRGPRARLARFAWGALVLPLAAVFAVSFRVPLWLPRYFVMLTAPLALLLAYGLARLRPPALAAVWGVVLAASWGYACARYQTDYSKEPWREAVARIAAEHAPGGTAALVTFDLDPFTYYDRRQPHPVQAFEVSHPDVPFASSYTPRQLDELTEAARRRTRDFQEVWVVVRSPNSAIRREVAARAESVAAENRTLIERDSLGAAGGPLRLVRYRRVPPSP